MKQILVTGGAGFIGSHLIGKLLEDKTYGVTCVDNFDPYYDPAIKRANLAGYLENPRFQLVEESVVNREALRAKLPGPYHAIVHLAAKVGVRPSLEQISEYYAVNVSGTNHVLELARDLGVKQFIFASSSSVYGVNPKVPWSEEDANLMPISPYAATKLSGEMMGHVYAHLYGIRFVALRFFTVYGPRQRPDLAISKFARLIEAGLPIPVYGDGSTRRDYTFVDDIVAGIVAALHYQESSYEIINLGNHTTISLAELIALVEQYSHRKAVRNLLPEQPGDVHQTYADIRKAQRLLGYQPVHDIRKGLEKFMEWYRQSQRLPV